MAEPISLALAKAHLRVTSSAEDTLISGMIADARAWVEQYTGQTLVQRSRAETIQGFESRLLAWPISSVEQVSYYDPDRDLQTLSADVYEVANITRPGRLMLKSGQTWPSIAAGARQITVDVVAGYDDQADIPGNFIRAMYVLIGGFYANRGTLDPDVEKAAKRACGPGSRGWRL